jgi:hypothetical protein
MEMNWQMKDPQDISFTNYRSEELQEQGVPLVSALSLISAMRVCDAFAVASTLYGMQQRRQSSGNKFDILHRHFDRRLMVPTRMRLKQFLSDTQHCVIDSGI